MTIKQLILQDFGVNLPIKGGTGNSIDTPVIIERVGPNDYVSVEHTLLKYLGIGRGITWQLISQELLNHNSRNIDKLKIETKQLTADKEITQIENYYFDITECMVENEVISNFNEEEILEKIITRLKEIRGMNDFNNKCIELLKEGKLQSNVDLTMDFLKVLSDEGIMTMFEPYYENTKRPLLLVLPTLANRL